MNLVDDKTIVRQYFNSTGFDRWQRIYGEGKVNKVQLDIRTGHQKTVDTVIEWLQADGNLPGLCVCDAGCGVGSLSIPLADAGAIVCASDISEKMVAEAYDRSTAVPGKLYNISFAAQDLDSGFRCYEVQLIIIKYHCVIKANESIFTRSQKKNSDSIFSRKNVN
jgi:magnesium-protoporphyrin O-methyltransferase